MPESGGNKGRRHEPARWSLDSGSREFGCDWKTLRSRFAKESIEPGADGRYSTAQIIAALYGDRESEELREIREKADKLAIANRKARGELIPAESVYAWAEGIFIAIRQAILNSGIPQDAQDAALTNLQRLTSEEARKQPIAGSNAETSEDPDAASEA